MLQMMQNKVIADGKKAEELYDKFMCYCETGAASLGKSIAEAEQRIPQMEASIKESAAMKEQLTAEVEQAKKDRAEAKEAIAKASEIREKEATEYAKVSSEYKSNIGALGKAIAALEKGVAGGFLQTQAATVLKQLSFSMDMSSVDRNLLAAFLSEDSAVGYVPQSGEIIGILKQLKDEMDKDLAAATAAEVSALSEFKGLKEAKDKQIEATTAAIESKLGRMSELGVELATMKEDLEDTTDGLAEDKKFIADMDTTCELKKKEWAEYKKMQAQELLALAETIKVLNDDDALDLFKKTLPSLAQRTSLLETKVTERSLIKKALVALALAPGRDPRVDFLELALRGQKIGFEKIIKLIDDLVAVLAKEQAADQEKKDYCLAELDTSDDKKKALEHDISDLEKAIANGEEVVASLKGEIEALEAGIKDLDKAVAEATAQRKVEHSAFVEDLTEASSAKELLDFAKNRLNKFYNPKLYKAPPKRQLSEEERITVNMGGTLAPTAPPAGIAGTGIGLSEISVHRAGTDGAEAPPPPPEADLAYKAKGQEGTGVIAMIDLLKADLDKQIATMEVTEKNAQSNYESYMSDASEKRADDSKNITDKSSAKAATEEELLSNKASLKGKQVDLMETEEFMMGLHKECDWLLDNFDLRKEARAGEVEALKNAKDVLQGADYSM